MTEIPEFANAALALADGRFFFGRGLGKEGVTCGEICFNTSYTGYQEILTDPSYAGQIITFTFPHIGNVGANNEDMESVRPFAKGLVLREDITGPSNFRSSQGLDSWLKAAGITGICGIDTREITHHIRCAGAQNCALQYGGKPDVAALIRQAASAPGLAGMELAASVAASKGYSWKEPLWKEKGQELRFRVVAVDFGAKQNILRHLVSAGCDVAVVPAQTTAAEILAHKPDGVFLSNGPGDPEATSRYAAPVIKELLEKKIPIFGICLGHQLLAVAAGAKTAKMECGHRGANHPVKDLETGKVEITSQNHGFVVLPESLPKNTVATHISLFDGTVEGLRLTDRPAFSVQYHPESSPGPHDSTHLFRRFAEMMESVRVAGVA